MNAVNHEPSISPPPEAERGRTWRSWFDPGEPHPSRGPLTRWPHATDTVLALIVFGVSLVAVAASALDDGEDFELGTIGDQPLGLDDQGLAIDITNTTNATSPGLPASGYGIVGMRERAHLLGGTLTAWPQPPDRYRVQARLPLEPGPS